MTYDKLGNMKESEKQKKLLSIGEVAQIFGLDKDTLRNWEKKGLITPLRMGPRSPLILSPPTSIRSPSLTPA